MRRSLPAAHRRGYARRVKLASLPVVAALASVSIVGAPASAQELPPPPPPPLQQTTQPTLQQPQQQGPQQTPQKAAQQATQPPPQEQHEHEHPSLLDRPHTVLDLEAGIIALPNAAISQANRGGATPLGTVGNGDATLQTGVHILYRANGDWAIGAGALFAPRPTADTNYGGASGLSRTHSRSYLTLGGEARYYPLRSRWFEGWFGLTVGAVVVGDRYVENNAPPAPSILGNNETTVSSEGFGVGVQIGADYLVTDSWVIGLALRADRWFLPAQKTFSQENACDPVGDCPTLTGSVAAFEFGLTVGYRIPL